MTATMKFFVNGNPNVDKTLALDDSLSENEYFAIADENKDETKEYVSIYVEFPSPRENLIILSA